MPIQNYAVLKVRPVAGRIFQPPHEWEQPHYHIHGQGSDGSDFDIAVDILSHGDSEVWYHINNSFTPPNVAGLRALTNPLTMLDSVAGGLALDYLQTTPTLVTPDQMTLLPIDETNPKSELHNQIDALVQRAIQQQATIYAFGQAFTNQGDRSSPFWHFTPDQGIHDIHMNQLNPAGRWSEDNGPYQDGALFVEFSDGWSAVFITFQSQSFVTRTPALAS